MDWENFQKNICSLDLETNENGDIYAIAAVFKDQVFQQLFPDQPDIVNNCFACHQAKSKSARKYDYCSLCPIGDCQPEYANCKNYLQIGMFEEATEEALILSNIDWNEK